MKGKIFGILAIFLIGLLSLSIANAADYNTDVFDDVELDGKDLSDDITRMRDYDRGVELELTFDIAGTEITNTSIEDARVEAFIRGDSHGDDIEDISKRFDIKSDRVYSKELTLELPDRMDRDVYTLTILLTSKEGVLAEVSYDVSIASGSEDHKIVIKDVIFSPENEVKAGRAMLATVKVKNMGTRDEDDVKVKVAIPDLGISASAFIDEVEAEDEDDDVVISEELYMRIPTDALTGDYEVVVTAEYDGDMTAEETYMIHVNGVEQEAAEVIEEKIKVSYLDAQDITAGEAGKMYPITITNPTAESKIAVISIEGVDVFGEARVEPSNVVIVESGATKMIPVYVSAGAEAAAGEYTFTVSIEGLSEDAQAIVMTANVAAEEADAGWENVKKGLEIGLIVLVVLLVLLGLIIGFGKLRSNDEDEDDSAQTYY